MKKWVKIKDGENKVFGIYNGKNTKFLENFGFVEMEVEESEKGGWYRKGTAPKYTEEELANLKLQKAKMDRNTRVSNIVVEVDGMKFDGDETSQDRMARSLLILKDGETAQWVLADNTIAKVTKDQLSRALRLAGEEQMSIWSIPYLS